MNDREQLDALRDWLETEHGQNWVEFAHRLLDAAGARPRSAMLIGAPPETTPPPQAPPPEPAAPDIDSPAA